MIARAAPSARLFAMNHAMQPAPKTSRFRRRAPGHQRPECRAVNARRLTARALALLLGATLCFSCHKESSNVDASTASASASGSAAPAPTSSGEADGAGERESTNDRLAALLLAEQRRATSAVLPGDLRHSDAVVRRAAARALARIADDTAHKLLVERLRDDDDQVIAWAAYGIGYSCQGNEYAAVRALVTRAASLSATREKLKPSAEGLEPFAAIADALARCGGVEAEATLKAWLASPISGLGEHAAWALTRLATNAKSLHGETIVGLIDAASAEPPMYAALAPLGRFDAPSPAIAKRLRSVASKAIDTARPESMGAAYAVRALAGCGADAAPELHRVVVDKKQRMGTRVEAARGLAKLEAAGQTALRDALAVLAKDADAVSSALMKPEFALILELVTGLKPPLRAGQDALERLAELPLPSDTAGQRRAVLLRCAAAVRVAGTRSLYPKLVACDPKSGFVGERSVVEVLDAGPLTRARYIRWLELTRSDDRRVRQAALNVLPTHPEASDQADVLAAALKAKEPGTVAVAAQLIASHPDRSANNGDASSPLPELVNALFTAAEEQRDPSDVETQASLVDALAAVQLKDEKLAKRRRDLFAKYCKSVNSTLRSHAEKAIRATDAKRARCDRFVAPEQVEALAGPQARHEVVIELELETTKVGFKLNPTLAPVAVSRIARLVTDGFYNGLTMHRVVPGFVVQFGDPFGDSYGGAKGEPLRCETSPVPFGELGVGLALSGRDTASSQLFVTLGSFPRLDGNYPLLGRATGDWTSIAEGDTIVKARVVKQ